MGYEVARDCLQVFTLYAQRVTLYVIMFSLYAPRFHAPRKMILNR